jgi:hypothetical protein
MSDAVPIQNDLKQRDAVSPSLFKFALEYAISKVLEWSTLDENIKYHK